MSQIDVSVDASVRRGALYLFSLDPEWIDHIDLDRLDMSDGDDCALGQFAGPGQRYRDAAADLADRIASGRYGPEMVAAHAAMLDRARKVVAGHAYTEEELSAYAAGILFGFQALDHWNVDDILRPAWVALVEAERLP